MALFDNKLKLFVLIAFVITIPTWFVVGIKDDNLHWLIWDLSVMIRLSLLPLLAFILVEDKIWKIIFFIYFLWTITNIVGIFFEFYNIAESWMTLIKAGGMLILLFYCFVYLYRKGKINA